MKKRITAFISGLLCLAMLLCLVGCNGSEPTEAPTETPTEAPTQKPTEKPTEPVNDNDKNDSDNDTTINETDEEKALRIFGSVKNAYNATKEYKDNYTATINISATSNESETMDAQTEAESATESYTINVSCDVGNQQLVHRELYSEKYGENERSSLYEEKYFNHGGEHIELFHHVYNGHVAANNENYTWLYKYSDAEWNAMIADATVLNTLSYIWDASFGSTFDAVSYEELTGAYAKVLPEVLNAEISDIVSGGHTAHENSTVNADVEVNEADGTLAVTLKISYLIGTTYASGGDSVEELSRESTVFVRNGLISGFKISCDYKDTNVKNGDTATESYTVSGECKIDYSFNKELYDSIDPDMESATLKENVGSSHISHTLNVSVNGSSPIEETVFVHTDDAPTFSEAVYRAIYSKFAHSANESYTVEWFTDKEYSAPLSFNSITDADALKALTDVYIRITPHDGYAVIFKAGDIKNTTPREYTLVFGTNNNYSSDFDNTIFALPINDGNIGELYTIYKDSDATNKDTKIYINGALIPDSDFGSDNSYTFECSEGGFYFVFEDTVYTRKTTKLRSLVFDF